MFPRAAPFLLLSLGLIALPGQLRAEECDGVDNDGDGFVDEEDVSFSTGCGAVSDWGEDPGVYTYCDLNVGDTRTPLSYTVNVDFDHPCTEHWVIELITPTGSVVTLARGHGGCNSGRSVVDFDDSAGRSIADEAAPWGGAYRPEVSLSDCIGPNPLNGSWSLRIVDEVDGSAGVVTSFGITATYAPVDADGDGYGQQCDCNDSDPEIHPGMEEDLTNGIDDDCDGYVDNVGRPGDWDGDGQGPEEGDCDDENPDVYLGAEEVCDGEDNNCDNLIPPDEFDLDDDGFASCNGDCNSADPTVFPGAPELCDYVDNNCDGVVDEDCGSGGPQVVDGCSCASSRVAPAALPAALALLFLGLTRTRRRV